MTVGLIQTLPVVLIDQIAISQIRTLQIWVWRLATWSSIVASAAGSTPWSIGRRGAPAVGRPILTCEPWPPAGLVCWVERMSEFDPEQAASSKQISTIVARRRRSGLATFGFASASAPGEVRRPPEDCLGTPSGLARCRLGRRLQRSPCRAFVPRSYHTRVQRSSSL
jgi:hypothetical protein